MQSLFEILENAELELGVHGIRKRLPDLDL
jgi:hypothetical protein